MDLQPRLPEHEDSDSVPTVINRTKKKSKGRTFQCTAYPPCSMSFTRSEHLARHIRSHTGEKPFKCQHCQKNFSRLDNLRQHRQTVHAYENFILTYPNEKLMIRVRNDEFNEVKKNLGIDESNLMHVSNRQYSEQDEVNAAQQLNDLRNNQSPNPITPINSFHNQQQAQAQRLPMLSPPDSTSPHNHHEQLPPPRSSESSSLLRPLQFRPGNNKRPRPILVPDSESSPESSLNLSTPLTGRSLASPLSPYYNSHLHHLNNQAHPPSQLNNASPYLSPFQQSFSQHDIKDHKKLPAIKFRERKSPVVPSIENRFKMKVENLMNDNNETGPDDSQVSSNTTPTDHKFGDSTEITNVRLPSFKELDFK